MRNASDQQGDTDRQAPVAAGINARTIAASICCISIAGFSLSLSFPLLSLVMEQRGVSDTVIGLNTATAGLAALVISPLTPMLVARIGVTRLLIAALAVTAVTLMSFPFTGTLAWFPLRFAYSAAATMVFVVSEFWINASAPDHRRGFVMGIYASVLAVGFAAGPLLLGITGSQGLAPFAIGALAFVAAMLPVALARGATPSAAGHSSHRFVALLWVAPTATLAAFVFGAAEQICFAFLALFGLRNGLSEANATLLLTTMALGGLFLQIPLGLLADRVNRTVLLAVLGIAGAVGMAVLPAVIATPQIAYPLLLVWGGLVAGFYTVGLTQLGARFKGRDLASANAMFVMLYAAGMMAGPFGTGIAMERFGNDAMAWCLATMFALYALIALWQKVAAKQPHP